MRQVSPSLAPAKSQTFPAIGLAPKMRRPDGRQRPVWSDLSQQISRLIDYMYTNIYIYNYIYIYIYIYLFIYLGMYIYIYMYKYKVKASHMILCSIRPFAQQGLGQELYYHEE